MTAAAATQANGMLRTHPGMQGYSRVKRLPVWLALAAIRIVLNVRQEFEKIQG